MCIRDSAGTYDSWYWAHPPMYFEKGMYLPLVEKIRDAAKVPLLLSLIHI